MADSRSSDGEQIIEVTFNQQQYIAIEKLRVEAQFGANANHAHGKLRWNTNP